MRKFEYLRRSIGIEQDGLLDRCGREGWELVSVIQPHDVNALCTMLYVFKREISDEKISDRADRIRDGR